MRRLPPMSTIKNLAAICELIQDDEVRDDVMIKSDQPLRKFWNKFVGFIFYLYIEVAMDEDEGREFLQCEYNKDGDSFRSPWTNKYYPPVEVEDDPDYQPIYPSQDLLEMEQKANELFWRYTKLYYDGNFHTSVYFFDTDTANGFGSCWLIKKSKSTFKQSCCPFIDQNFYFRP